MPSTGGDPASATSSDHPGVQTISYKPADIRSHAKRVKQARGSACRYLAAVPELGDGSTSGGTWARKLVDLPVSGRFWNPRARYRWYGSEQGVWPLRYQGGRRDLGPFGPEGEGHAHCAARAYL